MIQCIDEHRVEHGVESICQALVEAGVAPSTYYASQRRPPSPRACRDAELSKKMVKLHREHKSLYAVRQTWHLLHREGVPVARCTVSRLMRNLGLVVAQGPMIAVLALVAVAQALG